MRRVLVILAGLTLILLAVLAIVVATSPSAPPQLTGSPAIVKTTIFQRLKMAAETEKQKIEHRFHLKLDTATFAVVNTELRADNGTWSGSPTSYTYQWEDCNSSGASCVNITGATGQWYMVHVGDEGYTIVVVVTATNANGSTSASSTHTNVIATPGGGGGAPTNTVPNYFISSTGTTTACTGGCAIVGQVIGTTNGTDSCSGGCGTVTYTYQWFRCATTSAQPPTTSCPTAISGATSSTYTVAFADVGHSLTVEVTALNNGTAGSPTVPTGTTCNTGFVPHISYPISDVITTTIPSPQLNAGCSPISAVVASTQAGEGFCTNAPTTCGYADPLAGSAGVPSGTSLSTTGSCSSGSIATAVSTASSTINGCLITGGLNVTANNVTVENSQITGSQDDGQCVTADGNTGDQFLHDTVNGTTNTDPGDCAWAFKASNVTVDNTYVYNVDRIMTPYEGTGITNSPNTSTITLNNDVCWGNGAAAGEHRECVYNGGDTNMNVDSSALFNLSSETAAFYIDLPAGNVCSCTGIGVYDMTNNLFSGGGYEVYGGNGNTGPNHTGAETWTGNRFSRMIYSTGGQYSLSAYIPSGTTQSGNIFDDTAAATGTLT